MLVGDVMRLDKRVDNLGKHFELAQRDVQEIKTSTGKISNRGRRIEDYDVETEEVKPVVAAPKDLLSAANEKALEIE
jgi:DNA recombination protein RmuC